MAMSVSEVAPISYVVMAASMNGCPNMRNHSIIPLTGSLSLVGRSYSSADTTSIPWRSNIVVNSAILGKYQGDVKSLMPYCSRNTSWQAVTIVCMFPLPPNSTTMRPPFGFMSCDTVRMTLSISLPGIQCKAAFEKIKSNDLGILCSSIIRCGSSFKYDLISTVRNFIIGYCSWALLIIFWSASTPTTTVSLLSLSSMLSSASDATVGFKLCAATLSNWLANSPVPHPMSKIDSPALGRATSTREAPYSKTNECFFWYNSAFH